MSILWPLRVLLSHWLRHPAQLAAFALGLAAATALWSGVQALNVQARTSYDRAAAAFSGASGPRLVARDGSAIDEAMFARLRRAGWPVSPVLEGGIDAAGDRLRLIGVEPVSLPAAAGLALFAAGGGASGGASYPEFVLPPGRALISPQTMAALGLAEGDRPMTQRGRLPPVAAAEAVAPGAVAVDIGFAQPLLGMEGRVGAFLLGPRPPGLPDLATVAPGLRVQAEAPQADLSALTESFHMNLAAFGLLSFLVGLFIVHGAVGLAFEQRLATFRTLRACGLTARGLALALSAELLGFAVLAGLAGVALGHLVAAALLPDVAASLRGLYGARVPGELSLSPWWWAAGVGMSVLGAGAAAAGSLTRALRLPLLESARPQAWRAAEGARLRRQGAAALALLALAAALPLLFDGLEAGFAMLAALLIGAALGLPAVLSAVLTRAAAAARRPLWRWAWADGRQQLPGLSLALMALLLALAVNIGVGTMVEGFRRTFTGWLDGRLAAEVYLRAADEDEARRLERWLSARPDVTAVLPDPWTETVIGGWPAELHGLVDHPTYRDLWPLLERAEGAWDAVAAGEGAMVSEQLARRLGIGLGDAVTIPAPGGPWTLRVAGIHADYGNPRGDLRVNAEALVARWPGIDRLRMAMRIDPEKAGALVAAIRDGFALDGGRVMDQGAIKRLSAAIFERTFAVTAALNALTLGVAGIALFTSLSTLAAARLPQVAPLWAIGVTRRRLALIELGKTTALALLTAVLAAPLGVAVAWALVAVVNVEAFGWRLPLHLFPWQWARLAALAVAAAALASALPLLRLARTPPATLVKVFADER